MASLSGSPAIIRRLSATDIARMAPELSALLVDVVNDGASIGYHAPMGANDALAYWAELRDGVSCGERVLLVAHQPDGALCGTAQLVLEQRPNGRHRAEVQKVMVAPGARGHGVGAALMHALDDEARRAGRTLLVLDTREDDAAERLYRQLGWTLSGRIPGYVLESDGRRSATLVFYRSLADTPE
jgi:acetyltransferase